MIKTLGKRYTLGDVLTTLLVRKGKLKAMVLALTKKEQVPNYQALISKFGFPQIY